MHILCSLAEEVATWFPTPSRSIMYNHLDSSNVVNHWRKPLRSLENEAEHPEKLTRAEFSIVRACVVMDLGIVQCGDSGTAGQTDRHQIFISRRHEI